MILLQKEDFPVNRVIVHLVIKKYKKSFTTFTENLCGSCRSPALQGAGGMSWTVVKAGCHLREHL